MTQTPDSRPTSIARPSRLRGALMAGVGALALAGVVAAPELATRDIFPFASQASAQTVQPQRARAERPAGFADVVEQVKPAVVSVRVRGGQPQAQTTEDRTPRLPPGVERFFREMDPRFGGRERPMRPAQSQGSGFFISADGFVVTNNHVVENAGEVQIVTDDGRTLTARVVGADPRTDLALLKVDGGTFPFVRLAERSPRVGDWVLAVGNPFGLGGTVTAGIVSARGRDIGATAYDDFLQIDAPVNRGNSGGPSFDMDGAVVGVNTAIFSPSGGNVGIAFAIPSSTVATVIEELRTKGQVTRGWIGVQIQPVTADIAESIGLGEPRGALVAEATNAGPAARAGIRSGDAIVAINGERVRDARELSRRIAALGPGTSARLTVFRDGREQTVEVALGTLPQEAALRGPAERGGGAESEADRILPRLGLELAPARGGRGVVVTGVDPSSPAADRGLREGDVILDVGGRPVSAPGDIARVIREAREEGRRGVLMRVRSGETVRMVPLPVGRG